jgi:cytochrome c oxidase cbb3-type subunit 2
MRTVALAIASVLSLAWVPTSRAAPASAQTSPDGEGRGERIYGSFCSSCHGRYGRGDGPLAQDLEVKLPDFTDPAWRAGRSVDQIVAGLRGAPHSRMAIATVLEPGALHDAVAYVAGFAVPGEHVSVMAGRDIYQASCWVCHGLEGKGNGPASEGLDPKPRNFTSPEFVIQGREDEVYQVISQGAAKAFHGSPYMVEWSSRLSPQQIRDVIAYIQTFKH